MYQVENLPRTIIILENINNYLSIATNLSYLKQNFLRLLFYQCAMTCNQEYYYCIR